MPATAHPPTFILGCVRSGTTLLRNMLRQHPGAVCPEETQYYRWGHPFGTDQFVQQTMRSRLLARHRALDGIDEGVFQAGYAEARTRADLMRRHMALYGAACGGEGVVWFDKSPQNVYGIPLILHDFPDARFVHIVRSPLNVVASLLEGVVVSVPDTVAAANYWFEAVAILNTLKPLLGDRLLEVRYEALTEGPAEVLGQVLRHMGLDTAALEPDGRRVHRERDRHRVVLQARDYETIQEVCGRWAEEYGYDLTPPVPAEAVAAP